MSRRRSGFLTGWLVFGLVFLYGPIVSMIIFSFNNSRLATVWGGFSTRWYGELWENDLVIEGGLRSLEICKRAGVPVAYGTDLLGQLQSEQSREFLIRAEVQTPIEIIRAATLIGAEIVRQVGKLGCIKAGAYADLLVIDGNPMADLGVLQEQGKYLAAIMKGGRFHKNRLC